MKGVQLLLDERKLRPGVDFDAIVTASDLLALGALDELQKRGIRVPEEVALVGFNDRVDSKFTSPPLTSVRLPFYKQGHRAVELLLALLAGEQIPDRVILPSRLKVRQSCGCLPPAVTQAAAGVLHTSLRCEESETFETALAARRAEHRLERHPLVDDRHRRLWLSERQHRITLLPRVDRALVPVWGLLPLVPPARLP